MPDLSAGQQIAQRFKLTSRLEPEPGCERWLAEDLERDAPAVLSIFLSAPQGGVDNARRGELRRLSRLVHPGIAPCLGLFEWEGLPVLAHAQHDGADLRDWSARDYREVMTVLLPVMEALAYLHDLGIAHGRVSERTVRRAAGGQAVLTGAGRQTLAAGAWPTPGGDVKDLGSLLARLTGSAAGTPLPGALAGLIDEMQAESGDVPDMHAARRRVMRELQLEEDPASSAKIVRGAAGGRIAPRSRQAVKPAVTAERASRPGVSLLLALPALLALAAVLVVVLVYLPEPAPTAVATEGETKRTAGSERARTQQQEEATAAPFEAAAAAKLRQDAQDAAMSLLRSLVALEERAVSDWGSEEFEEARRAGETGDAAYREQRFAEALRIYRDGLALAESLVARSGEVLAESLAAGDAALAAGEGEEARRWFELAAAIDKDNPEAQAGLQRTEKLAQVLSLMREAAREEQSGNLAAARDGYRAALAADPEFALAQEALKRVQERLASRQYQQSMSRGFAELNRGNAEAARREFQRAARIRPEAAGPRDALAEVGVRARNRDIEDRRAAAEEAERDERWKQAAEEYRAILDLDSTLVFAREGAERAAQRAQLAERMGLIIDDPLRMFSNEIYNEARSMLVQARLITAPGPELREQIAALTRHVELARKPVTVQMQSDGLTSVVIYKVGELGRFDRKAVGLIPGRYTAVGTRRGYRDVRREFVVRADASAGMISVVCEEPV